MSNVSSRHAPARIKIQIAAVQSIDVFIIMHKLGGRHFTRLPPQHRPSARQIDVKVPGRWR